MVMKKKSNKETTTTACCSKVGIKRGPWTAEEDDLLASYVRKEGEGRWRTLPKRAGLSRCGKSCRLRWMNYLRPSVKRGHIAPDEEDLILRLHRLLGNRWSLIAGRIPGRTDNEIKNYWNTHLSKKLISQGIDPRTHKPFQAETPDSTNALASRTHNPNSHVKKDENEEQRGKMIQSNGIQLVTGTSEFNVVDDQVVNNNFENYIDESTSTLVLEDDDVFASFLNSLINEDADNSIDGIAPFTDHPFLHG